MDVLDTKSATTTPTAATNTTSSDADPSSSVLSATSDFETFLTLLTTQLENQDPLNPLESTDFVAQLASFSAVEQQVLSNSHLSKIASGFTTNQASDAAIWLDRNVLAPASTRFDGAPIEVEFTLNSEASTHRLEILDESEKVVAVQALSAGNTNGVWNGELSDGSVAADGRYSFRVANYDGDELINYTPGNVFAKVTEVRLADEGTFLVLEDGTQIDLNNAERFRA